MENDDKEHQEMIEQVTEDAKAKEAERARRRAKQESPEYLALQKRRAGD